MVRWRDCTAIDTQSPKSHKQRTETSTRAWACIVHPYPDKVDVGIDHIGWDAGRLQLEIICAVGLRVRDPTFNRRKASSITQSRIQDAQDAWTHGYICTSNLGTRRLLKKGMVKASSLSSLNSCSSLLQLLMVMTVHQQARHNAPANWPKPTSAEYLEYSEQGCRAENIARPLLRVQLP